MSERKVTITFTGDQDMIEQFMSWLDGQGEQDFWEYSDPADTIDVFEYDYKNHTITGKRHAE